MGGDLLTQIPPIASILFTLNVAIVCMSAGGGGVIPDVCPVDPVLHAVVADPHHVLETRHHACVHVSTHIVSPRKDVKCT